MCMPILYTVFKTNLFTLYQQRPFEFKYAYCVQHTPLYRSLYIVNTVDTTNQ